MSCGRGDREPCAKYRHANPEKLSKLRRYCKKHGLTIYPISDATGKGRKTLLHTMADLVEEIRRTKPQCQSQNPPPMISRRPMRSRHVCREISKWIDDLYKL